MFDRGTIIGNVDTDMDDDVWKEEFSGTVAIVNMENVDCKNLLEAKLHIGKDRTLNSEQRAAMVELTKKRQPYPGRN